MNKTPIEYLTHTWNLLAMRCTPVSEGCANCWHLRRADMFAQNPKINPYLHDAYRGDSTPLLVTNRLKDPLKRKKPAMIGVQFMGDLFHPDIPYDSIDSVVRVVSQAKQHTFLFLTKRADRMTKYFQNLATVEGANRFERPGGVLDMRYHPAAIAFRVNQPLPNLWPGVSVENQRTADERIPVLLKIPAAVRWISAEPLLERIDVRKYFADPRHQQPEGAWKYGIGWTVCGSETGPGARPMDLEWPRDLRDQAKAANVPFFIKQVSSKKTIPIPDDLFIREFPNVI